MIVVQYTGPHGWGNKAYQGDAGIDLPIIEDKILMPGEFADLPSGIRLAIPEGFYGRIVARSSALRKKRIRVYEGIIDAGFRGELFTYIECIGPGPSEIKAGDRLAQLIVSPIVDIVFTNGKELPESERGTKGFGSSDPTGTNPAYALAQSQIDNRFAEKLLLNATYGKPGFIAPELHDEPRILLYVGGPIDHANWWYEQEPFRTSLIQSLDDFTGIVYNPKVHNDGIRDPSVVFNRNMRALLDAKVALFCFMGEPGNYGFGSPIEIHQRVDRNLPTIVYVKGHSPGVYLRALWQDHGLILTDDWNDTLRLLGEELHRVG